MKSLLPLLLLAPSMLLAKPLPENLRSQIFAPVVVDAKGHIQSIGEITPALDANTAAAMIERIQAIEFEPALLNGVPAPVEATLWLTLGLREVTDGLRLEVVDVYTGAAMTRAQGPKIPPSMMRRGENVTIMTLVRYDEAGSVVEASVESATIPVARVEDMALKAAYSWEFKPENVAGHAIGGWARVPIKILLRPESSPTYTVRLDGGSKLQFRPQQPKEQRESFATALDVRLETVGGELELNVLEGS
jgi:hypothetical protein